MSDLRRLLHAADGGPVGRVDPEEIRRRGRRLIATRVAAVAGAAVATAVVVGGMVLGVGLDEPARPVIEQPDPQPPPADEDDTDEPDRDQVDDLDAAAGFVPPTRVVDGHRVVELRFPGRITGEIAYPADLDLHEQGTAVGASVAIMVEDDPEGQDAVARGYGRPRLSGPVEVFYGPLDEVLRRRNDGEPAEVVAEYPGPDGDMVPLYATAAGDVLAWQVGSWTLLVGGAVVIAGALLAGVVLGAANRRRDRAPVSWPRSSSDFAVAQASE